MANTPTGAHSASSSWPPHITVATIVEHHGKFLMVEERDGELTVFNQPAGHLEPNETLVEAAIRETREETGWDVELTGFVGLYQYYSAHNDITYLRVCFSAIAILEHPGPLDEGILAAHWLSPKQLDALEPLSLRSPLVKQCINDFQQNGLLPIHTVKHLL